MQPQLSKYTLSWAICLTFIVIKSGELYGPGKLKLYTEYQMLFSQIWTRKQQCPLQLIIKPEMLI